MNRPKKKRVAQIGSSKGQGDSWQPTSPCRFQQLPQSLIMDILSRLSPNTLLSCRCVCKPWLFLISDPHFNRLRQSRSPMGILIQTTDSLKLLNWKWKLYNTQWKLYNTQIVESTGRNLKLERLKFLPEISVPVPADTSFPIPINSCDGLLCLASPDKSKPVYVCNPISGEFITTPPLPSECRPISSVGIGFSAATDEYKVICNCGLRATKIYTIGTEMWRDIENLRNVFFNSSPFNALLHGAFHWASRGWCRNDNFMHSFNLETEKFGTVPPPSQVEQIEKLHSSSLGVLEGCLLLCGFGNITSKCEIWIMRDYGVQESWTKTFVIEGYKGALYQPMFLSNGEMLMLYDDGVVVRYNPETKKIRKSRITPFLSTIDATGYSPSFVSLHNIAKGEEVKRLRNNESFTKLFTEGSVTAAGSRTSAHQCTNVKSGSCPPGVEEAPRSQSVATSSATRNEQLDFALRIGTKCAICAEQLGYVFRGKGFALCQKCFDASSS